MTIAVYGASGRTGSSVVAELERLGLECVAGGRDESRLRALAERSPNVASVRVAEADDFAALRRMGEGCSALVNCAGPRHAVVAAGIAAGLHCADAGGEQPWIRSLFEHHGAAARERGVALVPALGFDYAPGDCLARIAASGHEPLRELVVAYAIEGAGTAGDSMKNAGAADGDPEVVWRERSWRAPAKGVERLRFAFPEPLGRRLMQRYGSGEQLTVPRHTTTRSVVTLITASTWAPHPRLVPLVPYLRPAVARARGFAPARALLVAAGKRATGTPGAAALGSRFTVAAVARGEGGSTGRALAEGGDFHELTAGSLALGASWLARGRARGVGALGPAAAFEPAAFLDALRDRLRWEWG